MIAGRIPVIDTDTHVTEPPDLWTARMSPKYGDLIPHVEHLEHRGEDAWIIGGMPTSVAWGSAMAGFDGWWPLDYPKSQDEIDPAAYDSTARSQRMDEFGISMQVLYPNLMGFQVPAFLTVQDPQFRIDCVRAYNDFLVDFSNESPGRFIPITALPFWDLDESLSELKRAADAGHRGILFAANPERAGLPRLRDEHWDPLWHECEDRGLSVNFHVGFGVMQDPIANAERFSKSGGSAVMQGVMPEDLAAATAVLFLSNATTVCELIVSGLCHRFPKLNFVSVESGFGYLPYTMEALDWQWLSMGAARRFPDRLMPSEYFKRQIYGTFWFEKTALEKVIGLYPDNVMFETDFPHPTSLAPGPTSYADLPSKVIEANLASLPEDILRKLLYENAARVYNLD